MAFSGHVQEDGCRLYEAAAAMVCELSRSMCGPDSRRQILSAAAVLENACRLHKSACRMHIQGNGLVPAGPGGSATLFQMRRCTAAHPVGGNEQHVTDCTAARFASRGSIAACEPATCTSGVSDEQLNSAGEELQETCRLPFRAVASQSYRWLKYGQRVLKTGDIRTYLRCKCESIGCKAKLVIDRSVHDQTLVKEVKVGEHNHEPGRHLQPKKMPDKVRPPAETCHGVFFEGQGRAAKENVPLSFNAHSSVPMAAGGAALGSASWPGTMDSLPAGTIADSSSDDSGKAAAVIASTSEGREMFERSGEATLGQGFCTLPGSHLEWPEMACHTQGPDIVLDPDFWEMPLNPMMSFPEDCDPWLNKMESWFHKEGPGVEGEEIEDVEEPLGLSL